MGCRTWSDPDLSDPDLSWSDPDLSVLENRRRAKRHVHREAAEGLTGRCVPRSDRTHEGCSVPGAVQDMRPEATSGIGARTDRGRQKVRPLGAATVRQPFGAGLLTTVRRGSPDPAVGWTEGLPVPVPRGDLRSGRWQGRETSPQLQFSMQRPVNALESLKNRGLAPSLLYVLEDRSYSSCDPDGRQVNRNTE